MLYEFKTKPYEHQKTALRRSGALDRNIKRYYAWLMEMGTGKSKVDCDETGIAYSLGLIDVWIIWAPKGVYNNWIKPGGELETHLNVPYTAAKWQAGGGNASNQRELTNLLKPSNQLRILVINVESISSGTKALRYVEKLLESTSKNKDGHWKVKMSVDEATKIKNAESKRTKNMIVLGKNCAFKRILTGSPITKNPLDAYGQFTFLDPRILGHNSWFSFRARYAVMQERHFGSRKVKLVVGFRNQGELSARIQDHSYRVLKEDCLDLPEKIYNIREVELTDEQHNVYEQMKNEAFAEIGETFTSATNAITILTKLQQIVCGHVKDAEGNVHRLPTNRIETLLECLEETDEDVIIWSRYREDISRIVEAVRKEYGDGSIAEYHGGNTHTRDEEARRFVEDSKCRFIISTQQSGGYGNTWLNGTQTIYYSNSEDLELRLQSEDRPHRAGQRNVCNYIDLISRGTIQEKLVKSLRAKMDIASTILGDNPREWLI